MNTSEHVIVLRGDLIRALKEEGGKTMDLTDVRGCMAGMPHKYTDAWEIEVAVIIVKCMSRGIVQDCFIREDLRNYYRFLQQPLSI